MKKISFLVIALAFLQSLIAQPFKQKFVSTDLENYWLAFDKIITTKDSAEKINLLQTMYLNKATPGLKGLIEIRNYTPQNFIEGIQRYPQFWASIKPNMLNSKKLYPAIEADIQRLKKVYPALKPSTIYFSVGAFRAGGTAHDNNILIGAELSLADKTTKVNELPEWRQPFYETQNPINEIALLCTHEYIHTQQKPLVHNLLSKCLYEGVAEFVSCLATSKTSTTPAIAFGKANEKAVINKFVADLFTMGNDDNWLWGSNNNELKVRDLGYYVGYEICERYYQLSTNKTKAIKDLIELDFTDEAAVERIVDITKILPNTLENLYTAYDKERPTVVSISPFLNGSQEVKPGLTKITVQFSEPLLPYNTGIDFGPLGQEYCPRILPERTFNAEGTSWTFEADLLPNQRYQILISNNFRKANGVRLKPYLIDIKTGE